MTNTIRTITVRPERSTDASPEQAAAPAERPSRKRLAMAFGVAALSDVLSWGAEIILPLQWALDLATALLLFVILGRRWAILPGLVAEAIPGMGVFPVWVLVVVSIVVYDDVKARRT
jgi:hypothetical protein